MKRTTIGLDFGKAGISGAFGGSRDGLDHSADAQAQPGAAAFRQPTARTFTKDRSGSRARQTIGGPGTQCRKKRQTEAAQRLSRCGGVPSRVLADPGSGARRLSHAGRADLGRPARDHADGGGRPGRGDLHRRA